MILLLDTSTYLCRLTLVDDGKRTDYEWQADRQLAKGLLGFIDRPMGCRLRFTIGILLGITDGPTGRHQPMHARRQS